MDDEERRSGHRLLETGVIVGFRQGKVAVVSGPDEAEFMVRIELTLGAEADEDPAETAEWAALGFLFVLATLSFRDARPRGLSGPDFIEGDELSIVDFVDGLRYERGCLRFAGDYIRGRRVKTDIVVQPEGTVSLETRGRGKAPLRWLDALSGKKFMQMVPTGDSDGQR